MIASPAEIVDIAEDALYKKATSRWGTVVLSATYAGALIALGFVFYTTTQVGAAGLPFGVAKLLGGLAFSTGLALVVILGADLFTSTTMTVLPGATKKLPPARLLQHWGVVYAGNFLGALLVAAAIFLSGTPQQAGGQWGAVVIETAAAKVSHGVVEAFFLGILCNIMVCLAVWVAYAGRSAADKIIALTLPIALFVATGFEHCVANMFMIPLGLMLKAQGASDAMAAVSASTNIDGLTLSSFLVNNLVPVTLGNIVGGGVILGLGMYLWHRADAATQAATEVK